MLCPFPKPRKNTAGVLFLEATTWRPCRRVIFYSLGQGRMKNRDLVSRWPHSFPLPDGPGFRASPQPAPCSQRRRPPRARGPRSVRGFFLPPPPLSSGRTSLEHGGFSLRLPPRRPARHPSPPRPQTRHTHARTHRGRAQRLSKPPFISPHSCPRSPCSSARPARMRILRLPKAPIAVN